MSDALISESPRPARVEPLCQKLPGGRRGADGLSKEEVAADQRRRLQGATIEAVAGHGYAQTTAREVCRLAGVSERAFYELFPDRKQGCFLASYDTIVRCAVARIAAAHRSEKDWEAKLRVAFGAYAAQAVEQPQAARLVLVEALGAGPEALQRMRDTRLAVERILDASFAQAPGGVAPPPLVVKGIVCGVERVTRRLLLAGGVGELPGLADELLAWALSYRSPAAAALGASAAARTRRRVPDRPGTRGENDRVRILRCAAQIAATGGYDQLTPGRIAREAGVREATFEELFQSTEQCFLDALDRLGLEALVCAARASQASDDRLAGVHRGMVALMERIASDPVLVRVAFVEIFALGPAGIERRERLLGKCTDMLARSVPRSRRPSELVVEASIGAIWGNLHHHVTRGACGRLPELAGYATYLALAPAIGGEAALAAILAGAGEPVSRVA